MCTNRKSIHTFILCDIVTCNHTQKKSHNALSKFMILCWVAFIPILNHMWPVGHGLDGPDLQGNNSRVDEAENQINDLEHKETKSNHTEQQEAKGIQKMMIV